jgi:hypothetical protein
MPETWANDERSARYVHCFLKNSLRKSKSNSWVSSDHVRVWASQKEGQRLVTRLFRKLIENEVEENDHPTKIP